MNRIFLIISTLLTLFYIHSCKKLDIKRIMAVRTDTVVVSNTAVTAKGTIIDLGQGITDYGFCWATTTKPTINDNKTSHGSASETGSFIDTLTNLSPNTAYYIVAYAKNSKGTFYSKEINFTTKNFTPTVTTTAVSSITQNSANSGGNVTDDGGASVIVRGVCWCPSQNPTIAYSHTTDGSGTGIFTSSITGLSPNITYYGRAYATNSEGTSYGNEINFTTSITKPTVTTTSLSSITHNSANSGGNVTADGGATIIVRGVCWSTSQNPTTDNSHTTDGSGTGTFTSSITGLIPNTSYYLRAYATNSAGTSYGNEINFTTSTTPTVTTTAVYSITNNSAISGGNVTDDGGATVTTRGVCWSTSQNPTTSANHTTDGSGTGIFTSSITGLILNTSYYLRAYATNSVGTSYGEQKSFTTLDACLGITSISYGGQTYDIIAIGNQCWMTENINIGTRIDSYSTSDNQTDNDTIEKYCYENNDANCDVYGGLYQWDEMMQYNPSDNGTIGTTQGVCPDGWHLPTDAEWTTLTDYLGGESVAGGKMKETGFTHWNSPNTGATNESGFTALPGGFRFSLDGSFFNLGSAADFWTATESDSYYAWLRYLTYGNADVTRDITYKTYGSSVRCLKD